MSKKSIYRCAIVFTDDRCKGQDGGNLFMRAETANNAAMDAISLFKKELAKNGFEGIAFQCEVHPSSEKECQEYKVGMRNRVN
jgi:hypothetical protein